MKKLILSILFALVALASFAQHQYGKQVTVSGTDTYTTTIVVPSPPPNYDKLVIYGVKFPNTNTGASTFNVTNISGAGAVAIRYNDGDSWEPLPAGKINVNTVYKLSYNGSYFQLEGDGAGGGTDTNTSFNALFDRSHAANFTLSRADTSAMNFFENGSGPIEMGFPDFSGLGLTKVLQFAFFRDMTDTVTFDLNGETVIMATADLTITNRTFLYVVYRPGNNQWYAASSTTLSGAVAGVEALIAGNLIDVDATDPANPIISVETGDKGDITIGSNTLTIDNFAVTNAKINDVAIGKITGFGTGIATALAINAGSAGAPVLFNGAGGTPSSLTGTNVTGVPIDAGTTGTLPETRGGTDQTTYTQGDILYSSSTNNLGKLGIGASGYVLSSSGTAPQWVASPDIGTHDLFISAAGMWPRVTGGCAALVRSEIATSLANIQSLDFDAATDEFAQVQFALPRSWNNGTITVVFYWTASSGTGNVVWTVAGGAYSDDDALTVALGTAQSVTDGLTATNDLMSSSATSAMTLAGTPADADFIFIQVSRDADNGSDTFSADAKLLGISIRLTTDASKDN